MRVVESPHTIVTGRSENGAPVLREVVMHSTAIVSTQGPALRALAAAWGEERLRMLWAPARVPEELAEGVALWWAEAAQRAAWEATRGAARDRAVEAWADGEMREAGARYAGGEASAQRCFESERPEVRRSAPSDRVHHERGE